MQIKLLANLDNLFPNEETLKQKIAKDIQDRQEKEQKPAFKISQYYLWRKGYGLKKPKL